MDEDESVQGRYGLMLKHSATAAICAGPDNLILSWNMAAEELFGYTKAEALGQPLSIIIPPHQRAAHEAGLARAVRSGKARLAGSAVEIIALHAQGHEIAVDLSLSMWFEDGKPMFGALVRDISDRQAARRRLEHLAHCDTLTSLPNRNALNVRLDEALSNGASALLLLDLDGFKLVNDTLGHSVGDQLLTLAAARLEQAAGDDGFVARLGGDEFAVLMAGCADPLRIDSVADRIFDVLRQPFELAGQTIFIGTSIGIVISDREEVAAEQMLSRADLALYSAKSEGGGVRRFFVRAMQNQSEQRHRLGTELRTALGRGEFALLYQPQVSLAHDTLSGAEALLRWNHPEHGQLPPQTFLGVLEDSVVAEEVGDWIIDQACAAAADWRREGLGSVCVGVNLFPVQLRSGRLFDVVVRALERHALPADQLEIEITENTVLRHNDEVSTTLRRLKALGVRVAFDDFGTGFASLSLLQKYPLDRLKIDRSFVRQIDRSASDAAIVQAVIGMARTLGLNVIAEGVETLAQETALLALGCDEAQGYRYGQPMPADAIARVFLRRAGLQQVNQR